MVKRNNIVVVTAERNNLTRKETRHHLAEIKNQYGITFYDCAKNNLFNASDDEIQTFLQNRNAKREERMRSIMRETGMTREEVIEDFETKKDSVKGITFAEYYRNKYFDKAEDVIRQAKEASQKKREAMLADIMEQSGWTEDEMMYHIRKCDLNWNIPLAKYYKNRCWELSEEEVKEVSRNNIIKIFAEILGISYEEAQEKVQRTKKEYGIPRYKYVSQRLYEADEEQLREAGEKFSGRTDRKLAHIAVRTNKSEEEVRERFRDVNDRFGISIGNYTQFRLYNYDDDTIQEKMHNWQEERRQNIALIMEASGWDEATVKYHLLKCLVLWGIDTSHYMIFRCWEKTDEENAIYVTQQTSKALRMKYSSTDLRKLDNKLLFNVEFKDYIKRKFWINRDTSFEEFCEFVDGLDEFICKPDDSSNAIGVVKMKVAEDRRAQYEEMMAREKLILEEVIRQHPDLDKLYDGCVNTCRLVTVLKDDAVHTICPVIKVGNGGSAADNLVQGGLAAGIDVKTGVIVTDGVDIKGRVHKYHPTSGVQFEGFQIPNWDKALEIVDQAMRVLPEVGYSGWDVAITPEGAAIIEGNGKPDIGLCQIPYAYKGIGVKEQFEAYL